MHLPTTPEMSNGSQKAGMTFSEKLNKIPFITLLRPRTELQVSHMTVRTSTHSAVIWPIPELLLQKNDNT